MAKNILFFVVAFFIGVHFFFSCSKVESGGDPPTMEIFNIKPGEVIYGDSSYTLEVKFESGYLKGLSSYSIQIRNTKYDLNKIGKKQVEEKDPEKKDSAFLFYKNYQTINIFDSTKYIGKIEKAFRIDTTYSATGKIYSLFYGDHYFKVTLTDKFGNVVKDSFLIDVKRKPKKSVEPDPEEPEEPDPEEDI